MVTKTIVVRCPDCDEADALIRHGRVVETGHQRYRCKACGRTFSDAPGRGSSPEVKALALAAYQERASMRGIARTFKISRNTLTHWLKAQGVCAAVGAPAPAEADAAGAPAAGEHRDR